VGINDEIDPDAQRSILNRELKEANTNGKKLGTQTKPLFDTPLPDKHPEAVCEKCDEKDEREKKEGRATAALVAAFVTYAIFQAVS